MKLSDTFSSIATCGMLAAITATPVMAQPGSGVRLGPQTVLSPSVSGNVSYNDNLNLQRRALSRPQEEFDRSASDVYLEGIFALRLTHQSDLTTYRIRTWYSERRYQDFSELDRDNYGASASWRWLAPHGRTGFDGSLAYQRAADRLESIEEVNPEVGIVEFETASERVKRDEFRARLNLDQQILQALRASLAYAIKDTQYVDDQFNDGTEHLLSARLGYDLTPKTQPYLTLGLRFEDNQGLDGTGENPFAQIGFRYQLSDQMNVDANIGFERFTRTPLVRQRDPNTGEFVLVPGDELEDSGLKYVVILNYAATEKSFFNLSVRSGFGSLSNTSSNAREETIFSALFSHRTTDRIQQTFTLTWQENDFEEPFLIGEEEIDETSETFTVQYSLNYQTVRPWMSFFALVSYEDNRSDLPNQSYTESQITAGITLTY